VAGGVRTTISTTELRMAQNRINTEEENRKMAQSKREVVADSLQKFQLQVLELESNNEVAGELGPLQYLSGLTDISMDKIINILLLIIIFVFDPLAISLVIAANFAFAQAYPKKKYRNNLYGEKVEDKFSKWDNLEDIEVKDSEEIKTNEEFEKNLDNIEKIKNWEAAERRMEIIGQNGNSGEHYNISDLNQDGIIDKEEIKIATLKIEKLENILFKEKSNGVSSKAINNIQKEINKLKKSIN
jgi:hypothetical protein